MKATLPLAAAAASLLGQAVGTLLDERVFRRLVHRKLASEGTDGELHAFARGLREKQRRRQRQLGGDNCPGGAFLWKIVRDETNEHVGFGLGTMHVPTSEATSKETLASIMHAVDDSCDVYGELNFYSDEVLDEVIECTLSSLMGFDVDLDFLPGDIVDEARKQTVDTFRGTLDGHVMARGRPAGGVEDASTQCDAIDAIMDEGSVQRRRLQSDLFSNGDTDPLVDPLAQELVHLYNCGDGEGFVALYDMLALGAEFDEIVLDNRNHQMAEAVASILGSSEDEKVMFAFGLAHWIMGDASLDVLLEDHGYSLVHVPRWDEDDAVNLSNDLCGVEFDDDTELFVQLIGDPGSSGGQVATSDVPGGETTSVVAAPEDPVEEVKEEVAKLEGEESIWGHDVEILNDDPDTEENETYLSIMKLENKTM